jgi:hypothetical protein
MVVWMYWRSRDSAGSWCRVEGVVCVCARKVEGLWVWRVQSDGGAGLGNV